jgi:hypothetical protein
MSSHVHWIAHAGSDSSDRLVRSLHAGFARWLNHATGRLGPVFADRHRNVECDSNTALAMLAYIHNNPVRAGMVTDPGDSTWTSHRAYVGSEKAPAWLDVQMGLSLCGFHANARGRATFHDSVLARVSEPRRAELTAANLQNVLSAARTETTLPVNLTSPRLVEVSSRLEQRIELVVPVSCPARPRWAAPPLAVVQAVARSTNVSELEIRSRSRARNVCFARRQAMLVWVQGLARPAVEMAHALGISSSAASDYLRTSTALQRAAASEQTQALLSHLPNE